MGPESGMRNEPTFFGDRRSGDVELHPEGQSPKKKVRPGSLRMALFRYTEPFRGSFR